MKFTIVAPDYGVTGKPYTNNAATDAKILVEKVAALPANSSTRPVAFIGEAHDNQYDVARRKAILSLVEGKKDLVHVIVERFEGAQGSDEHSTEPVDHSHDVLPSYVKEIVKPANPNVTSSYQPKFGLKAEELQSLKTEKGLSGPADWNRNQWFVAAILRAIEKGGSTGNVAPIMVLCGDDHEKFLTSIFSQLASSPNFSSALEIQWIHYLPGVVSVSQHEAEVFNFNPRPNVKPAAYIRLKQDDEVLGALENGLLKSRTSVELRAASEVGPPCWAIFFDDENYAESIRESLLTSPAMQYSIYPNKAQRAVWTKRIKTKEELLKLESIGD